MPHKPTVTLVPDAAVLIRLADEADVRRRDFMTGFRAKYPVGSDVVWMGAESRLAGPVLEWSTDGETLFVQSMPGAEYWISPDAVIAALRE